MSPGKAAVRLRGHRVGGLALAVPQKIWQPSRVRAQLEPLQLRTDPLHPVHGADLLCTPTARTRRPARGAGTNFRGPPAGWAGQPKRLILVVLCPLDDPERHAAPSLLLPELAGVASGRRISSWWRPVRIARGSGERWFRRFGLPRQIVSPASFAIAVAPCPLVVAAFTVTAVPVSRAIATPRERHQLASQAGSSFLFSSAELG